MLFSVIRGDIQKVLCWGTWRRLLKCSITGNKAGSLSSLKMRGYEQSLNLSGGTYLMPIFFTAIMPNILHQLHKGVFKDQLVKWCTSNQCEVQVNEWLSSFAAFQKQHFHSFAVDWLWAQADAVYLCLPTCWCSQCQWSSHGYHMLTGLIEYVHTKLSYCVSIASLDRSMRPANSGKAS